MLKQKINNSISVLVILLLFVLLLSLLPLLVVHMQIEGKSNGYGHVAPAVFAWAHEGYHGIEYSKWDHGHQEWGFMRDGKWCSLFRSIPAKAWFDFKKKQFHVSIPLQPEEDP